MVIINSLLIICILNSKRNCVNFSRLFSSLVPFPGFYQVQTTATESALRDTIPDEEPCLIFDPDQHTVKSSLPCHTTPFALRNASISTLVTDAQSNNGPLNSIQEQIRLLAEPVSGNQDSKKPACKTTWQACTVFNISGS